MSTIDIPDWTQGPQSFRRALYPDGVVGSSPPTPSFTVAPGGTVDQTFTLPIGTIGLRLLATTPGTNFTYSLRLRGHQTLAQYYGDPLNVGTPLAVPTPSLPFTCAIENDWDTQVDIHINGDATQTISFYVSALFDAESPGQAGASQAVYEPLPGPGQAPDRPPIRIGLNLVAGAANRVQLLAGVSGQTIRVFGCTLSIDTAVAGGVGSLVDGDPNAGGANIMDFEGGVTGAQPFNFWGAPLTTSNGLYIFSQLMTFTVRGFVSVSRH